MKTVTLKEARQHLGQLVNAAARGEAIAITRRGKVVAQLNPSPPPAAPPATASGKRLPDLSAFRASIKVSGRSATDELLAMREEERP